MILNEEKFLEDFTYEIPKECERDFALVTKQSNQTFTLRTQSSWVGSSIKYDMFEIGKNLSGVDGSGLSMYYELPNNYKYKFKFIVPRADKDIDNEGLILPINEDSKNYFDIFLGGKLTQENGFVSYNKIYNKINTKIPDKYKCNGNYIIGCKFLPFVVIEPKDKSTYNDYVFIFDINKSITENKAYMAEASRKHFISGNSHVGFESPPINNLHFLMFDFNIEGYSEDDGVIIPTDSDEESIKDLLYHQYGNIFPRNPYKIIHKKQLGNDVEILLYKRKDGVDYSDILSKISGIRYSIGSGHNKFVMIWKGVENLNPSEKRVSNLSEPEVNYINISEALKEEGHDVDYDENEPGDYLQVDGLNCGDYASIYIHINDEDSGRGLISISNPDYSYTTLDLPKTSWNCTYKDNDGVIHEVKADINDASVSDVVSIVNTYFKKCKENSVI